MNNCESSVDGIKSPVNKGYFSIMININNKDNGNDNHNNNNNNNNNKDDQLGQQPETK